MVASAVLGAAVGTGLALVVAMTVLLYHYYVSRRQCKDWGDLERFETPMPSTSSVRSSRSCSGKRHGSDIRCISGNPRKKRTSSGSIGSMSSHKSGSTVSSATREHGVSKDRMKRWDSRGSRCSTKSCPPCYTYPQQVGTL